MFRKLLLLNGIAILAVVCNHAAQWGFIAMFWWTDRYQSVVVPNFDQMGSIQYFVLVIIDKLAVFSVPAFLFVSGYFVSYAAKGDQGRLGWKMTRARIIWLLIPYLIWSIMIFIGDAVQGKVYSGTEYLSKIIFGQAISVFFFIPLLCQLYLLSPIIVKAIRKSWKITIVIALTIQIGIAVIWYLRVYESVFGVEIPMLWLFKYIPPALFIRLSFFFVLGIVFGFHTEVIMPWIRSHKVQLAAIVIVFGILAVVESEVVFQATGIDSRGEPFSIPSLVYAIGFIFLFLSVEIIPKPFKDSFLQLGKKSYGIYLLHFTIVEISSRSIYHVAPNMLSVQALFQPVLIILAIGIPLLAMKLVAGSPLRRFYRPLFG